MWNLKKSIIRPRKGIRHVFRNVIIHAERNNKEKQSARHLHSRSDFGAKICRSRNLENALSILLKEHRYHASKDTAHMRSDLCF